MKLFLNWNQTKRAVFVGVFGLLFAGISYGNPPVYYTNAVQSLIHHYTAEESDADLRHSAEKFRSVMTREGVNQRQLVKEYGALIQKERGPDSGLSVATKALSDAYKTKDPVQIVHAQSLLADAYYEMAEGYRNHTLFYKAAFDYSQTMKAYSQFVTEGRGHLVGLEHDKFQKASQRAHEELVKQYTEIVRPRSASRHSSRDNSKDYSRESDSLRRKLDEKNRHIATLTEELDQALQKARRGDRNILALSENIRNLKKRIDDEAARARALEDAHRVAVRKLEAQRREQDQSGHIRPQVGRIRNQAGLIAANRSSIQNRDDRIRNQERRIQEQEEQIAAQANHIAKNEAWFNAALDTIEKRQEESAARIRDFIDDLNNRIARLSDANANHRNEKALLLRERAQLEQQAKSAARARDEAFAKVKDLQDRELRTAQQNTELMEELKRTLQRATSKEEEIHTLLGRLDRLEAQLDQKALDLKELQKERDSAIRNFNHQIQDREARIEDRDGRIREQEDQLLDQERRITENTARFQTTLKEVQEKNAATVTDLRRTIRDLDLRITKLSVDNIAHQRDKKRLILEKNKLDRDLNDRLSLQEHLVNRAVQAARAKEDAERTSDSLRRHLEQKDRHIARLAEDLRHTVRQVREKEGMNESHLRKIRELDGAIQREVAQARAMKNEHALALQNLENQVRHKDDQINGQEEQLRKQEKQMAENEGLMKLAMEDIEKNYAEITALLKKTIAELASQVSRLNASNLNHRKEKEQLLHEKSEIEEILNEKLQQEQKQDALTKDALQARDQALTELEEIQRHLSEKDQNLQKLSRQLEITLKQAEEKDGAKAALLKQIDDLQKRIQGEVAQARQFKESHARVVRILEVALQDRDERVANKEERIQEQEKQIAANQAEFKKTLQAVEERQAKSRTHLEHFIQELKAEIARLNENDLKQRQQKREWVEAQKALEQDLQEQIQEQKLLAEDSAQTAEGAIRTTEAALKDLEALRTQLREKENGIVSLKQRLNSTSKLAAGRLTGILNLKELAKKFKGEALKADRQAKRNTIKYQREKSALTQDIKRFENLWTERGKKLENLGQRLEEQARLAERASREKEDALARLETLQKELLQKEQDIANLGKDLNEAADQIKSKNGEIEGLCKKAEMQDTRTRQNQLYFKCVAGNYDLALSNLRARLSDQQNDIRLKSEQIEEQEQQIAETEVQFRTAFEGMKEEQSQGIAQYEQFIARLNRHLVELNQEISNIKTDHTKNQREKAGLIEERDLLLLDRDRGLQELAKLRFAYEMKEVEQQNLTADNQFLREKVDQEAARIQYLKTVNQARVHQMRVAVNHLENEIKPENIFLKKTLQKAQDELADLTLRKQEEIQKLTDQVGALRKANDDLEGENYSSGLAMSLYEKQKNELKNKWARDEKEIRQLRELLEDEVKAKKDNYNKLVALGEKYDELLADKKSNLNSAGYEAKISELEKHIQGLLKEQDQLRLQEEHTQARLAQLKNEYQKLEFLYQTDRVGFVKEATDIQHAADKNAKQFLDLKTLRDREKKEQEEAIVDAIREIVGDLNVMPCSETGRVYSLKEHIRQILLKLSEKSHLSDNEDENDSFSLKKSIESLGKSSARSRSLSP